MSRSEKRFFKIHIETHSSKHTEAYKHLFDRIATQEEYDEKRLQEEFGGGGQRFPVLKHRLFEKVLESLEVFCRKHDKALKLRNDLNKAQVLYNRGLTTAADAHVDGIIDEAESIGQWELQLEAIRIKLTQKEADLESIGVDSFPLDEQEREIRKKLELIADEWQSLKLRAEVFRQIKAGPRDSQRSFDLQAASPYQGVSARASFLYHHALSAEGFLKNDGQISLEHTKACMDILEAHPYLTKDHRLSMAKMVANGFYSAYRIHAYDQAEELLVKLKVMYREEHEAPNAIDYLALYLQSKLFYENHLHSYHDSEHLIDLEKKYLESCSGLNVMVKAGIDYGYALLYHGRGERGKALKCVNRVLNGSDISRNDEVYSRSLVFSNVLYIEQDDREWLVHSARGLKRYLHSRGRLGAVEAALLRYIADIRRSRTLEGERNALEKYIMTLRSVRKDASERIAFEYFDFLRWAEERLDSGRRGFPMVA